MNETNSIIKCSCLLKEKDVFKGIEIITEYIKSDKRVVAIESDYFFRMYVTENFPNVKVGTYENLKRRYSFRNKISIINVLSLSKEEEKAKEQLLIDTLKITIKNSINQNVEAIYISKYYADFFIMHINEFHQFLYKIKFILISNISPESKIEMLKFVEGADSNAKSNIPEE